MTAPHPRVAEGAEATERLKLFTDAVVAIALTLLVLPLLETVPEAAREHLTTLDWLREQAEPLLLFALSFLLIASQWTVHARVFGHVEQLAGQVRALNFVWMFAVVFLPVATALIRLGGAQTVQVALYIGTLLLGSLAMSAAVVVLARTPALTRPHAPLEADSVAASFAATLLYLIALGLTVALPGVDYRALLLLLLMPVAARLLRPLCRRLNLGR